MSIYCWTLGEQALARICKKVYAKVRIVKNEDGLFHDEKVLGISVNNDGSIKATEELCYFIEILRSKERVWLPYTSLRLAQRSRPFYGPSHKTSASPTDPTKPLCITRKRKIKEDHTLPLSTAKLAKVNSPDLNATFDFRQLPLRQTKFENAYKEFIRRGKDMIFDEFFFPLQTDMTRIEDLEYILNVDASTEDKFETVLRNVLTEKEVKNYLQQCWRYNSLNREDSQMPSDNSDSSNSSSPVKAQTPKIHANWCLVCGKRDKLMQCPQCPSSYHIACRRQWIVTIMRDLKYTWGDPARMCLFLPSHTAVLDESRPADLQEAVLDACDDYIRVYLT